MKSLFRSSLLCIALLLTSSSARALTLQQWGPQGAAGFVANDSGNIVVNVDVVDVYFNVKHDGQLVSGLKKEDFVLTENGRQQRIRYFAAESQQPLHLAIMVDTSTSQARVLQQQQEVGRRFLGQVLTNGDDALVVSFDSFVQLRRDYTNVQEELVRGLSESSDGNSKRTPELDPVPVRGRSTALYDAILQVSNRRMATRQGRKAMVILTDGQDMGSRNTARAAIEAAIKSDTICYILLAGDRRYMMGRDYVGIERMKTLANETGGRLIMVDKQLKQLEQSFSEIALELRHHYSIGYTPTDRTRMGEYRTIGIRCRRSFQVQSRRGYYAVPSRNTSSKKEN